MTGTRCVVHTPSPRVPVVTILKIELRLNGIPAGGRRYAATPATIKDITDSYRRLNTKAAVTVFLIYDVAFAMVMPV